MHITHRFGGRRPLVTDPGIPGAALVLSADALSSWLAETLGTPVTVTLRRLSYQPKAAVMLAFDLTTVRGGVRSTQPCLARAYPARAGAQMAALREIVAPEHRVAHDPRCAVLVTTAGGDLALPLLPRLFGDHGIAAVLDRALPGHVCTGEPRVLTERYLPGRGWLGVLEHEDGEPLQLRAHRSGRDLDRAVASYTALRDAVVRTPGVLGTSHSLAFAAVGRAEGRALGGSTRPEDWRAAGAALAHLHESAGLRLPAPVPDLETACLERRSHRLAALLPERAADVRELTGIVVRLLERTPRDRVPLHGGFSPDRVVVGDDGVPTLVDLDCARYGPSAADAGSLVAAAMVAAETAGMAPRGRREVEAVMAGYASVRRTPDPFAVDVHTVAYRLRTALDPLLGCAPDWRRQVGRRVDAARAALDDVSVGGSLR